MINVKQLKDFLKYYNDSWEVIFQNGKEIVRVGLTQGPSKDGIVKVVLGSEVPTKECNICGGNVFKEEHIQEYPYYCPTCEENKLSIEVSDKITEDNEI